MKGLFTAVAMNELNAELRGIGQAASTDQSTARGS
jgi:hypothetical protein